jgi:hypothetical protein
VTSGGEFEPSIAHRRKARVGGGFELLKGVRGPAVVLQWIGCRLSGNGEAESTASLYGYRLAQEGPWSIGRQQSSAWRLDLAHVGELDGSAEHIREPHLLDRAAVDVEEARAPHVLGAGKTASPHERMTRSPRNASAGAPHIGGDEKGTIRHEQN